MNVIVNMHAAVIPLGDRVFGAIPDVFKELTEALNAEKDALIPPGIASEWQGLRPEGHSVDLVLRNAYQLAASQIPPLASGQTVVVEDPIPDDWLDLGQQGHFFLAPLLLAPGQSASESGWIVTVDAPGGGTISGRLVLAGHFALVE